MTSVEQTATAIVDAAVEIHKSIGPGMLESTYERLLEYELIERGHYVERQKYVELRYKKLSIDRAYCIDLFVNECVIVEIKSIESVAPVHLKQLLTYLKLTRLETGFLINFGQTTLKAGLRRLMNGYPVKQ